MVILSLTWVTFKTFDPDGLDLVFLETPLRFIYWWDFPCGVLALPGKISAKR